MDKNMLTGKNKHVLYYSKHISFKIIISKWKNPNLLSQKTICYLGKIINIKVGYSEDVTMD
jgi:hypothetical protein